MPERVSLEELGEERRRQLALLNAAEVELYVRVLEEVAQGVPIARIARRASIGRLTIYRLIERQAKAAAKIRAERDAERSARAANKRSVRSTT